MEYKSKEPIINYNIKVIKEVARGFCVLMYAERR